MEASSVAVGSVEWLSWLVEEVSVTAGHFVSSVHLEERSGKGAQSRPDMRLLSITVAAS